MLTHQLDIQLLDLSCIWQAEDDGSIDDGVVRGRLGWMQEPEVGWVLDLELRRAEEGFGHLWLSAGGPRKTRQSRSLLLIPSGCRVLVVIMKDLHGEKEREASCTRWLAVGAADQGSG